MQRYLLYLEYAGDRFSGSQTQPDGSAVQDILQDALKKFLNGKPAQVYFAGRTDAGVHAISMTAHVDIERRNKIGEIVEPFSCESILKGVNTMLRKQPVSIIAARKVHYEFHARFLAFRRTYVYNIAFPKVVETRMTLRSREMYRLRKTCYFPLFEQSQCLFVPNDLNVDAMKAAAKEFEGEHDFSAFRHPKCAAKSPVKTMESVEIEEINPGFLHSNEPDPHRRIAIRFIAPSYLYHQIRKMVAMLIEVGNGKYSAADVQTLLSSKNPSLTPEMVLPNGLFLVSVEYPSEELEKEPITHPQEDPKPGHASLSDGDEEMETKRRKKST
eukprot:TRINITY_DN900_c0_g1_i6.p1 TRINITY_DN900_c0_g1~~TRINITY_DN900_c0_g1_i6.p1  ORF type:complete len:355 (-),score=87.60 TRINITY_DN900_c0_g1_i6:573-1556(-)